MLDVTSQLDLPHACSYNAITVTGLHVSPTLLLFAQKHPHPHTPDSRLTINVLIILGYIALCIIFMKGRIM